MKVNLLLLWPALWLLIGCNQKSSATTDTNTAIAWRCDCLLDELAANDTLIVKIRSGGCFHWHEQLMQFYKSNNKLHAALYLTDFLEKRTVGPISYVVDSSAAMQFASFLEKGQQLPKDEFHCTTIDSFEVQYQSQTIHFIDGNCGFLRHHDLINAIFPAKELDSLYLKWRRG